MDGITRYKVRITFIEELLGSAPLNQSVYSTYIASKAPATANGAAVAAEALTIVNADEKGRTGFHRDEDGSPFLYDYVVRGFMKEAWSACREQRGRKSAALKAGKSKIDRHVFVFPRRILLKVTRPAEISVYERPLKAETMQGPRVALASSEMLPKQTYIDFELHVLAPDIITEELLQEWFGYGRFLGMGQWRSGSHGRFEAKLRKLDDAPGNGNA